MNLKEVFDKCLSDIGGDDNEDVLWYLKKRPKVISRKKFFEAVVWAIWVSGKSRKAAEVFLKKAEDNRFIWDFSIFGSWNKQDLRKFMESLHGQPVPQQALQRWQSVYNIAKELTNYADEKSFSKSFFGGKVKSETLDKDDVQSLKNRRYPFIKEVNSAFILRNMGGEFIKCDRWIKAFLQHYKISLYELEMQIKSLNIPLGLFDAVLWAYCEKFVGKTDDFSKHFKKVFA